MARATEANSREGEMERQREGGRKVTTCLLKCDQLFLLLCHNTCLPLVQSFSERSVLTSKQLVANITDFEELHRKYVVEKYELRKFCFTFFFPL